MQETFRKYGIIPYYGDNESTSHSTLQVLSDVTSLSYSHETCKNEIKTFSFGEHVDIAKKGIPGFLDTEQEGSVSLEEKKGFIQWLQSVGISLIEIIEITRELFGHKKDTGNAYLHVKIVKVGSTTKVYLIPINPTDIAYLRTKKLEDKIFVVTEYWDEQWWLKKKPQLIKASEPGKPYNWNKSGNVMETVIHFKRGTTLYGRPEILPLLNWMFAEYETGNQIAKVSTTEFTAKHALFFEETDPSRFKGDSNKSKEEFRNRMASLRKITTNQGEHGETVSLIGMEYPYGQKAPEKVDFEVSRDTEYTKEVIETASTLIYTMWGWSKQLSGYSDIKGNIGSNILIDLFTTKNVSTIYPIQSYWENSWADIFSQLAVELNHETEYTIQFPDLLTVLTNSLVTTRQQTTQAPTAPEDASSNKNVDET